MANSSRPRAEAASFAHLAGLGRARAEDDDDRTDDERDADMRRMEDNGEDTGETDDEKEARHARESKRAKAADEDPDDDGDDDSDREEMSARSATTSARRRERARCAAIFSSQAAGRNPVLAAHLAFRTDLTRREAIRVLRDSPAVASASLGTRAANNPRVSPGREHNGGPAQTQSMWDRALAKAGVQVARR